MAGKKGMRNVAGMKHRKKGGKVAQADSFDRSSSMNMISLVERWLTYLADMNYSPRSIDVLWWSLRSFLEWSQARDLIKPEQVTKPILESYQRWLARYRKKDDKPLSVETQRKRVSHVQLFFAHLCKKNFLTANPASDLELPRKPQRRLPKGLNREEIKNLMNIPDIKDPLGLRDRAILELFYATAIRRRELVNLELQDIDLTEQTVHIREGKGGKSRLVPMSDTAAEWLQNYVQEVRPLLLISSSVKALFITSYGDKYNPNSLGNWMVKTLRAAGIEKHGSCHLLRHSCATHMLENGADVRVIQQLLGHSKLDTTSIYTEVAITHLQDVYSRTHPTSKKRQDKMGK